MDITSSKDIAKQKSNCDWIVAQAKELQALFAHESKDMICLNKTRALADIETIKNSLAELESYIKDM